MTASRSVSLIDPQRAISASVRPQPTHWSVAGSMVQTLLHGEAIGMNPWS